MRKGKVITLVFLLTAFICACTTKQAAVSPDPVSIDDIAES
jgi:nitrous oxide reductase accessory protein NosL